MKIIFLTLVQINSIDERGIYQDLLRFFSKNGHDVTIVCPVERKYKKSTQLLKSGSLSILQVKTLNIQKTHVIEKGIATLALEFQFLNAIKKYLTIEDCDLVLYATPPITFNKVISYIKVKSNAYSYLLLKDIFPQNAVDLKLMTKPGLLYNVFRKKEKELYRISDAIGCMSPANVKYILNHNPELDSLKVEVNPNSIEPAISMPKNLTEENLFAKYDLPIDKLKVIYGGNLGLPQGLDFLLETIVATEDKPIFFIVVGDGTEYQRLKRWFEDNNPKNAVLIKSLPKIEYDHLVKICDVGMIFLNQSFTIPNFPSRLLSYLEAELPVLAATDSATDIGEIIESNECGYGVNSGDQNDMQRKLDLLLESDLVQMKKNAKSLLLREYTVEKSYQLIINRIGNV